MQHNSRGGNSRRGGQERGGSSKRGRVRLDWRWHSAIGLSGIVALPTSDVDARVPSDMMLCFAGASRIYPTAVDARLCSLVGFAGMPGPLVGAWLVCSKLDLERLAGKGVLALLRLRSLLPVLASGKLSAYWLFRLIVS